MTPRRLSTTRTLAIVFFFGIVVTCCAILLQVTRPPAPVSEPEPVEREDSTQEEDFETYPPGEFPLPVLESRALAINGRVLDARLRPVSGLDVICGSDVARTDEDGRFVFTASKRPGPLAVALRRAGTELARWTDVVVGDTAAAPIEPAKVPRPASLRWSVNLLNLGRDDGQAVEEVLTLDSVLVEEWGRSGVVQVSGRSELPEGAEIHVAVYFQGDRYVSGDRGTHVKNGAYHLRFTLPTDFRFFSDHHDVEISFSTAYHDFETVERWKKERPNLPWDDLSDHAFTKPVYIGFPEEERQDNLRVQNYYRRVFPVAVDMWTLLEAQFAQSMKLKRGWDPNAVAMEVDSTESWFVHGAIDRDGEFREAEWRAFIDDQFRPRLRELIREHSLLTDEKFPRATHYMNRLLDNIVGLSRMDSLIIYKQLFGLGSHPRDFYHDDYKPAGDRVLVLKIIRQHIELLQKFLDLENDDAGTGRDG